MLTNKKLTFVKEYIVDLNATSAAIKAGYSAKTAGQAGSRLLDDPEVGTAIQIEMDKRAEKTGITAEYVLTTIHETIERCKQNFPVLDRKGDQVYCETPDGEVVPAFQFDSKGVLKGCELLGKHLKLFTEKVEHSGDIGFSLNVVDDTDE